MTNLGHSLEGALISMVVCAGIILLIWSGITKKPIGKILKEIMSNE